MKKWTKKTLWIVATASLLVVNGCGDASKKQVLTIKGVYFNFGPAGLITIGSITASGDKPGKDVILAANADGQLFENAKLSDNNVDTTVQMVYTGNGFKLGDDEMRLIFEPCGEGQASTQSYEIRIAIGLKLAVDNVHGKYHIRFEDTVKLQNDP